MSATNDGAESVDQFLARIASIKEPRDQANEERTKRLEEDFVKSRKERQARRLERARSLSPSKTGPARPTSISSSPAPTRDIALNPPVDFSPRASTLSRSNAVRTSPTLEPAQTSADTSATLDPPLSIPSTTASPLARSGTLSWQQRRTGREDGLSRPRPMSTIGTIRTVQTETIPPPNPEEQSRENIAASLAAKDPAWFRQTQERGVSSAAYRRNQVENAPLPETTVRTMRLPGMSKDNMENEDVATLLASKDIATSKPLPLAPIARVHQSNLPTMSASEEPPSNGVSTPSASDRTLDENNDSGSAKQFGNTVPSPARTPSPTKGLGGFVQSAMMKRSDSVSKRWSVQANSGLKRGDSIASGRPLSSIRALNSPALSGDLTIRSTTSTPVTTPKVDSSQSKSTALGTPDTRDADVFMKSSMKDAPLNKTSSTSEEHTQSVVPDPQHDDLLSRSPSKTLDTRRWSPTKSSWLESTLLSQPEPPRMAPAKDEQPQWMVNLQRSRSLKDPSLDASARAAELSSATSSDMPKLPSSNIAPSLSKTVAVEHTKPPPKYLQDNKDDKAESSQPSTNEVESHHKLLVDPDSAKTLHVQDDTVELRDISTTTNRGAGEPPVSMPLKMTDTTKLAPKKPDFKAISSALSSPKLEKQPPVLKPKPQTPPKTDFRATLKSRAPPATGGEDNEPEFKAIFGKLKSAQTQNYVAPDELKNNILTGKAALNVTGGPQKTKRVDAFKESILQKKEAMKSSAEQKKQELPSKPLPLQSEAPLPEALARRKTLHKPTPSITKLQSNTIGQSASAQQALKSEPPRIGAVTTTTADTGSLSATSSPSLAPKAMTAPKIFGKADTPLLPSKPPSVKPAPLSSRETASSHTSEAALNPDTSKTLGSILSPAGPAKVVDSSSEMYTGSESRSIASGVSQTTREPSTATTKPELPPGSKLASRLNPNLAALLSQPKSPRPEGNNSAAAGGILGYSQSSFKPATPGKEPESGELTHATKARAKGPKRRAPKVQPVTTDPPQNEVQPAPISSRTPIVKGSLTWPSSQENTMQAATDSTKASITDAVLRVEQPKATPKGKSFKSVTEGFVTSTEPVLIKTESEATIKPKPMIASKSPELRRVSSTIGMNAREAPQSTINSPSHFEIATDEPLVKSPQLKINKAPAKPISPKPSESPRTVLPLTPSKTRVNTAKKPSAAVIPPEKPSTIKPAIGLGVKAETKTDPVTRIMPKPHPTATADKNDTLINLSQNPSSAASTGVGDMVKAFFPLPPTSSDKAEFDTHALLSTAGNAEGKVKTITNNIWEVGSGGRKSLMPAHQEHILFEESLYLLIHTLETPTGDRRADAYLWCGDGVAEGAIEDAQLFCKKDAREHNARLELIKQGKEHANFFQALGGILITRRSKSSALYMLCGRKHLGHVAFDEVDLAASELCSGFAYLISARFGRLILWKGKGAAVDEVGCARLIGMDLGLTGEIEEVDEGAEPDSFWDAFPARSQMSQWNPEWRQRAQHQSHPCKLYLVAQDRPKSSGGFWGLRAASPSKPSNRANIEIMETMCTRDLDVNNVYILDAYCSVYVLLFSQTASKPAEFVTALHLAQEIAMLSPSIQNRPLLPSCFVSFGEPPGDVKARFRKWQFAAGSSAKSGCVRLEDVMQTLGL